MGAYISVAGGRYSRSVGATGSSECSSLVGARGAVAALALDSSGPVRGRSSECSSRSGRSPFSSTLAASIAGRSRVREGFRAGAVPTRAAGREPAARSPIRARLESGASRLAAV